MVLKTIFKEDGYNLEVLAGEDLEQIVVSSDKMQHIVRFLVNNVWKDFIFLDGVNVKIRIQESYRPHPVNGAYNKYLVGNEDIKHEEILLWYKQSSPFLHFKGKRIGYADLDRHYNVSGNWIDNDKFFIKEVLTQDQYMMMAEENYDIC